ncbi:MAG TPA: hypothetical protein VKE96_16990 [Vicinamibacterales bacterium]|nr:hypothetical protein [Vicinamibacterales bacterium]
MPPRLTSSALVASVAAGLFLYASSPLAGQWLNQPTAGVPRTPDGKPNLTAATPRTPDGRPDFSGMWLTGDGRPCDARNEVFQVCGSELPMSRYGINMGAGRDGGLPYQPWAAQQVKTQIEQHSIGDPHARCMPDTFVRLYGLPHMQKFIQTPGQLTMLYELNANYRQVFLDGRPLPDDPQPSWQGYSVGKWEGDTLVVNSLGFHDGLWLDMAGSPMTDAAKVHERIRRPDFGHLEVEITVDDAKAYTKPWTVTLKQNIVLNTELVDEMCVENEKSTKHMVGK